MRICFVCLGNICRSPMADAIMKHLCETTPDGTQWVIDSCGTGGWHVGKPADPRTVAVLRHHNIPCSHRARQLHPTDYTNFDLLLAMDHDNLATVRDRAPATATAHIALFGHYDPQGKSEVGDPYYGGDDGFEHVFQQVMRCCQALRQSPPI